MECVLFLYKISPNDEEKAALFPHRNEMNFVPVLLAPEWLGLKLIQRRETLLYHHFEWSSHALRNYRHVVVGMGRISASFATWGSSLLPLLCTNPWTKIIWFLRFTFQCIDTIFESINIFCLSSIVAWKTKTIIEKMLKNDRLRKLLNGLYFITHVRMTLIG